MIPLTDRTDEELCTLLKKGDEGALKAILLRYWEPLYKMASYTLDDHFACEDLVQDIFINIWKNRESLNFQYSLKAYLFACTRYEVYRQIKLKVRQRERSDDLDFNRIEYYNPHNELEYKQLMENVERIVNVLPERCKEVYLLSREEQLSHKEIASRLKVSTKTVENQITIALRRIRNDLNRSLFLVTFIISKLYFIFL